MVVRVVQTCRQNKKNQPEREFLENGENPQTCKIRNKKQKYTKTEVPRDPAKREESQRNKSNKFRTKTAQAKVYTKRQELALPFQNVRINPAIGKAKLLLAVWIRCNMVSCNVVSARCIQEALPSVWHASKHRC